MLLATDVHYDDTHRTARAAGVAFERWTSAAPSHELVVAVTDVEPYASGGFYRRELPCLSRLLEGLPFAPAVIIIDGFVDLGPGRPGLGRHLYEHLHRVIPVVGAAKTAFRGAEAIAVTRGGSHRPIWVTAAGLAPSEAAAGIESMHGAHRLPTLLTRVDHLARGLRTPSQTR